MTDIRPSAFRDCRCGKRGWTTEHDALQVVVGAKIRRYLRNNQKRQEQRAYRCHLSPGLWHVTSADQRPTVTPPVDAAPQPVPAPVAPEEPAPGSEELAPQPPLWGPKRMTAAALALADTDVVARETIRATLPAGTHRPSNHPSTRKTNRTTIKFQDALRDFETRGWIVRELDMTIRILDRDALAVFGLAKQHKWWHR
jgi:hypothetical protein